MKLKHLLLFLSLVSLFQFSLSAEETFYRVNAENWLYLRSEPNQKAGIERMLAKDSLLRLVNSSEPIITLNKKKGRWVEVEYFATKGWVFDFYLSKSKADDPLILFNSFLKKLDSNKISSIPTAKDEYLKKFSKTSKDAENGFRLFQEFIIEVMRTVDSQYHDKLMENYADSSNQSLKELKSHGIDASFCEGDVELIEDLSYYLVMLKSFNFPLKKSIEISSDSGGSYACDAGIHIPWDEMRKRITRIESFLKKAPRSPENNILEGILRNLMTNYVNGMDNTPICDFETKIVLDEILQSYNLFEKENKTSKYYPFFKKYLGMLKANKNVCNDKIRTFSYKYFNTN